MTVFLPDTNILIDAFRHKRGSRELLTRLLTEGNTLACCDITDINWPVNGTAPVTHS
jgi:predicted nucleic acid-binding protein